MEEALKCIHLASVGKLCFPVGFSFVKTSKFATPFVNPLTYQEQEIRGNKDGP